MQRHRFQLKSLVLKYICFQCLKTKVHHKVHFDKLGTNFCSMIMKFVVVSSFLAAVASNPTEIPVLSLSDNTALTSNPTEIPSTSPSNNTFTWSNNAFPWNNETNTCLIECKADYGEWSISTATVTSRMGWSLSLSFFSSNRTDCPNTCIKNSLYDTFGVCAFNSNPPTPPPVTFPNTTEPCNCTDPSNIPSKCEVDILIDLMETIVLTNRALLPQWTRAAFHDAGTFNQVTGVGGANGCLLNHPPMR